MKKDFVRIQILLVCLVIACIIGTIHTGYAQQIKWLRVTPLQSPINEIGAEFEVEFPTGNGNFFSWPAQYSIGQNTCRMRGLWLGCMNFNDPVEGKLKNHKVIDVGPRVGSYNTKIFPKIFKLIGRSYHPIVTVDAALASVLDSSDVLDEVDPSMEADRMVLVKFNTSMGISVAKKVMVFDQSNHDNYFVKDFVFTNTGIYDSTGSVKQQTLDSVYFYFCDRYAFAGVSCTGYNQGWGSWNSTWGESNLTHSFGEDPVASEFNSPASPLYQLRAAYTWYGPDYTRGSQVSYYEDWGNPAQTEDGELASAKYAGSVTLHADKSVSDRSDDLWQPRTNNFIAADLSIMNRDISQYDEAVMADRWAAITDGHPTIQWDVRVGDNYPKNVIDPRRNTGGGTQPEMAFGPYQMSPGDSVHIVLAEGVAGISWEKGREVGGNWLQWRNNTGTPILVMPDGSTTTDHNLYKRKWCETGKDSILQTYRNAIRNYNLGYQIPKAPPPPETFAVTSGGNRILLEWTSNADGAPHFDGYVIYRSTNTVLDRKTVYEKIFECSKTNVIHSYDDTTAVRDSSYYYYIQTKDDGTQNDLHPGVPLYSSMFWTVTNKAASLVTMYIIYTGDANNDGIVDARDILPIGRYFGLSGSPRTGSFLTLAQHWTPEEACYADCDGNGIIDANDVQGIVDNWFTTHTTSGNHSINRIEVCKELLSEIDRQQPLGNGMKEIRNAVVSIMKKESIGVFDYVLDQNWPNPFNPSTTIRFTVPEEITTVKLEIINLLGQQVWSQTLSNVLPGVHEIEWYGKTTTGSIVASGVYFYRLSAGSFTSIKRMLFIK